MLAIRAGGDHTAIIRGHRIGVRTAQHQALRKARAVVCAMLSQEADELKR